MVWTSSGTSRRSWVRSSTTRSPATQKEKPGKAATATTPAPGGGAGADFLDGGGGSNKLDGGPGSDYCLQKGRGCEVSGAPFIPGKAPLPPGVKPPSLFSFVPALVQRAQAERLLRVVESQT